MASRSLRIFGSGTFSTWTVLRPDQTVARGGLELRRRLEIRLAPQPLDLVQRPVHRYRCHGRGLPARACSDAPRVGHLTADPRAPPHPAGVKRTRPPAAHSERVQPQRVEIVVGVRTLILLLVF